MTPDPPAPIASPSRPTAIPSSAIATDHGPQGSREPRASHRDNLGPDRPGSESSGWTSVFIDPRLAAITANIEARGGDRAALLNTLVMAEEAGEAVQKIRRYLGFARSAATAEEVAEEVADVVIATAVTASLLGIDLGHAIERKLDHIMARGGL